MNNLKDFRKHLEKYDNLWYIKLTDKLFPNGLGDYRAWYTIKHPWTLFRFFFRHIKWAWQRVFRGWDDRVIWSIDIYIAEMLPIWLKELKKQKQGTPMSLFGDNNFDKNNDWKSYPGTHETADMKYNAILNIIINGFEIYSENNDFYGKPENREKFDLAFKFFHEYFGTLWD